MSVWDYLNQLTLLQFVAWTIVLGGIGTWSIEFVKALRRTK